MIHDKTIELLKDSQTLSISGLRGASPACFVASQAKGQNYCCIVPDEHLIQVFEQDLSLFLQGRILKYPGHEIPPYTPLSPDQRTAADRLSTLYQMGEGGGQIMVTSIEALMRKIMPASLLTKGAEYLLTGEDCDHEELLKKLVYLGYDKVALVQSVGDFSVRGGIIDIYPPTFPLESGEIHEGPIRLDFFGDTIESIRPFDPFTQRSTGELPEATLLPVTDILLNTGTGNELKKIARSLQNYGEEYDWEAEETARIVERTANGQRFAGMEFFLPLFYQSHEKPTSTVFDFLPQDTVLVFTDPEGISQTLELTLERIYRNYQTSRDNRAPALPPSAIFCACWI